MMNTDITEDDGIASDQGCLDLEIVDQTHVEKERSEDHWAHNKDSSTSSPLAEDSGDDIRTDDHVSLMSFSSSILDSIVSGAIESIAMLSIDVTSERGNEGTRVNFISETIRNGAEQGENCISSLVHEGSSTRVYHYLHLGDSFGRRPCDVAAKILNDQFPDDEQIARLNNEYEVCTKLAGRCRGVRKAVGLSGSGGDGMYSLFLSWVPGTTLREWASSRQRKQTHESNKNASSSSDKCCDRRFPESSLCLALEITECLAEIHQVGGFVLNNLSASNIIVDEKSSEAEKFSVHIIGLGSSSRLQNDSPNNGKRIRNDLQSLGNALFELFSGKSPCKGDNSVEESDHLPLPELRSILMLSSVPSYIASFVLDLMEVHTTKHECSIQKSEKDNPCDEYYHSALQVKDELSRMLAHIDSIVVEKNVGWLDIVPSKLYGREKNQTDIYSLYNRVSSDKTHEVALVSGFSGVGKTALIRETLRQPLLETGGHLIHVKFDQLQQGAPLAAIIAAFSEFFTNIALCTADELNQMKSIFQESIDAELLRVLTVTMPQLCMIVGSTNSSNTVQIDGIMAKNQFKFAFQLLMKTFTELTSPIILFFDDIQWADSASVELMDALVMDSHIKSLLIIESYRSNEINKDRPFDAHLSEIKNGGIVLADIHIENLTASDVGKMMSHLLYEPLHEVKLLADTVHQKTGGNVFLVKQFINSLWDEGLLRYSSRLKAWKWNLDLIKAKKILSDAAKVMAQAIRFLPSDTKRILEKMACLGCQCEESILCLLDREKRSSGKRIDKNGTLLQILDVAICQGLVEKVGSKFKFTHDQIQHATYFGIPERKRELWHLQIGQLLLKHCESKELFATVDQLNRGRSIMTDKSELINLAILNCRAGEKAISSVSYLSAAAYLKIGIKIQDENQLKLDNKLYLKMYSLYAEAEYCNGNFDEMHKAHEILFTCAGSINEKLTAYSTLVLALAAQNKKEDAVEMGLNILEQLGEEFPSKPDSSIILEEFSRTKKMLEESEIATLSTKMVDDKCVEFIMGLLESLILCAHLSKQEFVPLFCFRMVQLTLRHGMCPSTPFSFAAYSMMLCRRFGDIKGGNTYGEVALELMESIHAEHKIARVYLLVYAYPFAWSKPFNLLHEPLLDAYHRGMKTGDNQYATACAAQYCIYSFLFGKELLNAHHFINNVGKNMKQYKQLGMRQTILPVAMAIHILMRQGETPFEVDGVEIKFETLIEDAAKKNDTQEIMRVRFYQMIVAYLFGNYELASEIVEKNRDTISRRWNGKFEAFLHSYYEALISLVVARKTKDLKWIMNFQQVMDRIQKQVENATNNIQHKMFLIEAEYAFLVGNEEAGEKYSKALAFAARDGTVQDQALAYESAGIYYLEIGNKLQASEYLGRAHSAYIEWGAKGKADHLCSCFPF